MYIISVRTGKGLSGKELNFLMMILSSSIDVTSPSNLNLD